MELRRAGTALMRTQLSTIITSSAVRSSPRRLPATLDRALYPHDATIPGTKRTLTSSAKDGQQQPPRNSKTPSTQQRPAAAKSAGRESLDDMITNIWGDRFGKPGTSRFKSPSAQARNRATTGSGPGSTGFDDAESGTSSVDEATAARRAFNNRASNNRASGTSISTSINQMVQPAGAELVEDREYLKTPPGPDELVRIGPSVGKSVMLNANRGQGLADGLRMVDTLVARNQVRSELRKQAFHERPGLKRKRLARERWRKRFMTGFKQVVARVQRLRKQGW